MKKKILLIEDNNDCALFYKKVLGLSDYAVTVTHTGLAGLKKAKEERPDLVILDMKLPDMKGTDVCAQLKADPETEFVPVMIMTGEYVGVNDTIDGLRQGADDYLIKPVNSQILVEKIRVILRRTESHAEAGVIEYKDIRVDRNARKVVIAGVEVAGLTEKEFKLFCLLVSDAGNIIEPKRMFRSVWGCSAELETRTIYVHVNSLRHKLPAFIGETIRNVFGSGYRLDY